MQNIIFSTHCNSSVVFVPGVHESCNAEKTNKQKKRMKKKGNTKMYIILIFNRL
jgi:hypothetical protein